MKVKATQSCLTLCDPKDYIVHGILQARILEWVAFPFSRGSSQPRDQTRSPTLQADSLPVEPQGKPKNTGVGSLSLLQQIFQTQELNSGLSHCSQILLPAESQREYCVTAVATSLLCPARSILLNISQVLSSLRLKSSEGCLLTQNKSRCLNPQS